MQKLFAILNTLAGLFVLLHYALGPLVPDLNFWSWLSWVMFALCLVALYTVFGGNGVADPREKAYTGIMSALVIHHTLSGTFEGATWDIGCVLFSVILGLGGLGKLMNSQD